MSWIGHAEELRREDRLVQRVCESARDALHGRSRLDRAGAGCRRHRRLEIWIVAPLGVGSEEPRHVSRGLRRHSGCTPWADSRGNRAALLRLLCRPGCLNPRRGMAAAQRRPRSVAAPGTQGWWTGLKPPDGGFSELALVGRRVNWQVYSNLRPLFKPTVYAGFSSELTTPALSSLRVRMQVPRRRAHGSRAA